MRDGKARGRSRTLRGPRRRAGADAVRPVLAAGVGAGGGVDHLEELQHGLPPRRDVPGVAEHVEGGAQDAHQQPVGSRQTSRLPLARRVPRGASRGASVGAGPAAGPRGRGPRACLEPRKGGSARPRAPQGRAPRTGSWAGGVGGAFKNYWSKNLGGRGGPNRPRRRSRRPNHSGNHAGCSRLFDGKAPRSRRYRPGLGGAGRGSRRRAARGEAGGARRAGGGAGGARGAGRGGRTGSGWRRRGPMRTPESLRAALREDSLA